MAKEMIREEAIKLLTQYIDYDAETPDYYEMEKACKAAIKALEQEPCEDAVSRDMVIKAVDAHTNEDGTLDDDISIILEDLPSVTPIPADGVLGKIRAEIIEMRSKQNVGVLECLDIIDKYKADKE